MSLLPYCPVNLANPASRELYALFGGLLMVLLCYSQRTFGMGVFWCLLPHSMVRVLLELIFLVHWLNLKNSILLFGYLGEGAGDYPVVLIMSVGNWEKPNQQFLFAQMPSESGNDFK